MHEMDDDNLSPLGGKETFSHSTCLVLESDFHIPTIFPSSNRAFSTLKRSELYLTLSKKISIASDKFKLAANAAENKNISSEFIGETVV